MPTINNILFPTDFSENAKQALPYALEIAHQTGATIHLLHSIEEPYDFAPLAQEVKKSVSHKVDLLLQEILEDIQQQKKYAKLNIKTQIQSGRALYTILEEAQNVNSDLIIMGTKGRSGLEKFFLGNTTAEIIEHATIPVLAIPRGSSAPNFERLLFTTSYKDNDLKALQYIASFAQLFESEITVFHAAMETDLQNEILFRGFRELVNESIAYDKIEFEQAPSTDFVDTMSQKVEADTPSIVVMVRYEKPFSFFGKKYSKEMSYSVSRPLLVVPGNQEFYGRKKQNDDRESIKKQPVKE